MSYYIYINITEFFRKLSLNVQNQAFDWFKLSSISVFVENSLLLRMVKPALKDGKQETDSTYLRTYFILRTQRQDFARFEENTISSLGISVCSRELRHKTISRRILYVVRAFMNSCITNSLPLVHKNGSDTAKNIRKSLNKNVIVVSCQEWSPEQ